MKQTSFQSTRWAHRFSHGGSLRNKRAGRAARPLTTKEPIHLVFKTNKGLSGAGLRSARRFRLVQVLLRKYSAKFHVKVEQLSIQFDHIHLLVRITRRSLFQHFLRVLSGQIAQQFQAHGLAIRPVTGTPARQDFARKARAQEASLASVTGTPKLQAAEQAPRLWKHRPFTRVVRGWRAYRIVREYIVLNEKEATGEIRYQKDRLRGLSEAELGLLRGAG